MPNEKGLLALLAVFTIHHSSCTSHSVSRLPCENGWIAFKESCYLVSEERKNVRQANLFCRQQKSTFFHAGTPEEFVSVLGAVPSKIKNYVFTHLKSEMSEPEDQHLWTSLFNAGWTTDYKFGHNDKYYKEIAVCTAVYVPMSDEKKEMILFPCTYQFPFICERNGTHVVA